MTYSDRQTQIIETSITIIAEQGMKDLTMARIAKRLGITDAALYRHFAGKRDILFGMVDYLENRVISRLESEIFSGQNPDKRLAATLNSFFAHLEQHKGFPRLLFSEAVHFNDPELRSRFLGTIEKVILLFRKQLDLAVSEGTLRKDLDTEAAARVLFGLIQSSALLFSLSDFNTKILEEPGRFLEVLLKGLE
jgi:TetR/AcrR family transcriptional regulator